MSEIIDQAIHTTNRVICENITTFNSLDRGLLSQNILSQLRNFVEYIAIKEYSNNQHTTVNPNDYDSRQIALKDMQKRGNLRFLHQFHEMLQKSVSHYTVDKDSSERLMLKYYEYLLKIKHFLKNKYSLEVLENISKFPLNTDTELLDYYTKIVEKIESPSLSYDYVDYNDRYYVQKVKPFFVNQKIFYEITFTIATEKASKFDRFIAFTQHEIVDNYAVKFKIHNDKIHIFDKDISILVIDSYEVSIRPCEWKNLLKIFGKQVRIETGDNEYKNMMRFLTSSKISLTELVNTDQDYYERIKDEITRGTKTSKIYQLLDECRKIITHNRQGANILRYLLHKMNNRTIKQQLNNKQCHRLSNLYLQYGCIPFDEMPYCSSLPNHNPKIYDIFASIPVTGRECELFAKYIKNNTEIEGCIFTPKTEIQGFDDMEGLIQEYNNKLYYKHQNRKLEEYKKSVYIREYVEDCTVIIKKLQKLASQGVSQYTASVNSWMESYSIDDTNKQEALRKMFADSQVALIYGAAGTGKSTLIKHISNFWSDKQKIYLANTHSAVDNMRRKVKVKNAEYCTIANFLSRSYYNNNCDILFIDECSTISNNDMRKVIEKANFNFLVLVGDIYQIEAIRFGNWFSIARKFIPKSAVFELTQPYRTTDKNLLTLWDRVRNLDDSILEVLVKNNYVSKLDESIFNQNNDDEIILCLNYDGLYGINNVNRLLQNANPNIAVVWGINTYKIGDPVLFNESNIFSPLIHNNSKGKIKDIRPTKEHIDFDIELEETFNEEEFQIVSHDIIVRYNLKLIGTSKSGGSIISFSVNKFRSTDEDNDDNDSTIVPFNIAYAISIHKAQGLEYNSVKIIITNEIEERITHNIFYTAITRAMNELKIYWSPETEQFVIKHLKIKNVNRDAYLLACKSGIPLNNVKKE